MIRLRYIVVTLGSASPDTDGIRNRLGLMPQDQLIVFDNALGCPSESGSSCLSVNRHSHNDVTVFSPVNLGYFGGVKKAVSTADSEFGDGTTWVVIANPDVRVTSTVPLGEVLERIDPEVVVVGPTPSDGENWWDPRRYRSIELWLRIAALRFVDFHGVRRRIRLAAIGRVWSSVPRPIQDMADSVDHEVFMVNGCIFAIRSDALRRALRDNRFPFLFSEEIILGEYFRGQNLRSAMVGRWSATHTGGTSRMALAEAIGDEAVRRVSRLARRDGLRAVLEMRRSPGS